MNSKGTIRYKLFLVPLIAMLMGIAISGCSDDKEELQDSQYGYVQFKIYKSASHVQEENQSGGIATRATTELDKLGDAQKIEIEMQYNGVSITQTLVLNAYNESNAEYGMRSDKLQLLTGDYKIVGYKLLDKLDNIVIGVSAGGDETFSITSRGLTIKDLAIDVQPRGTVTFKLIKTGLNTRANGEAYLFSNIKLVDVTVINTFTRVPTIIKKLKVNYKEEQKENQNPDNADDKYMDIGTAKCDSVIWLPAGTYQVRSYTTYSKSGSLESELETQSVEGETFTIKDNQLTEDAIVPIKLSETAEYIKDYKALKAIWEALDGKNWSQQGFGSTPGANWNFNKEIDMWGKQPGVSLGNNGRVTSLSLEGFGAKGRVPDAIGQLTELQFLALGSHSEVANARLFDEKGIHPNMSEEHRQKMRMHYKEMFIDYDPRESFSELLQYCINNDPKQQKIKKSNRISLKDMQIGYLSNGITFVPKAIMRLTKLRQLFLANSPFKAEDVCENWENKNSEYAKQYEKELQEGKIGWKKLKELTDVEVYNCSGLNKLPAFLKELPEMQALNLSCNKTIDGEQLAKDWETLADAPVGAKLQIIYLGYNNLKRFPNQASLQKMKSLGMLECVHNEIAGVLPAFGSDIKLSSLDLSYNKITDVPENFCGFTEQVEKLSFQHNLLEYIPNIFDAKSVHVMGSVDFSYNFIGKNNEKNFKDPSTFKGINASTIVLGNNRISKFPKELFSTGSPISSLNLNNNLLTEIPENSLKSKEGNYKNTHLLTSIDLRFNKLTKLSEDFRATTLPYLGGIDLGYNSFSKFPIEPLNCSELKGFGIRHQRDEKGNRTLREWPVGITLCPSLQQLQIGSNDIRKVDEIITPNIQILDIKDNPNITIDLSVVCPYIQAGMYMLIYDKTQDIRGCDALDIKR